MKMRGRTRLFAIPFGGDAYYEFDAHSMSSGDTPGRVQLEVSASDKKIVKKWHKAKVMLKFGIMFSSGQRITFLGLIGSRQKNRMNTTIEIDVYMVGEVERLDW